MHRRSLPPVAVVAAEDEFLGNDVEFGEAVLLTDEFDMDGELLVVRG
jgi:hypothetical protein